MNNVVNIKSRNPLHTDEAATGGSFALDALSELESCNQSGKSKSVLAVEHAELLIEDLEDCTPEEARRLLSGYLDMIFQFTQGAKFVPDTRSL